MALETVVDAGLSCSSSTFFAIGSVLIASFIFLSKSGLYPEFPAVGVEDQGWLRLSKAQAKWAQHSGQIIEDGRRRVSELINPF